MAKQFPLLISIPHGGDKIPPEVRDRLRLGKKELFEDSDAFSKTIYNIGKTARSTLIFDIFRAIVDPNRQTDDLPPANPDGVIKSHTCYKKKIYRTDLHNDSRLVTELLSKYYNEYHNRIREEINRNDIAIAFDCHTMASKAPDIAPDKEMNRPVITLGNYFGKSCDYQVTQKLAGSFIKVFGLDGNQVTINKPFAGGYITRNYGNRPVPWIQIEMNRCLYLDDRWFNAEKMEIKENRLKVLNKKFKMVVEKFFEEQYTF